MNWTRQIRSYLVREIPIEDLLPDQLPDFVRSYVYLFGVLTIASFLMLILSGIVLVMFGPEWWHISAVGRFFNSIHFWSVQAFFFFMVLHLWAQFFMMAWRGGRGANWITGVLLFVVSILAAFTGFLSQQNFDSQWIALQGKDAFNALGIGAFFNLLNFGQIYGLHVFLLPLVVAALIGVHLYLVRSKGVVTPYEPEKTQVAKQSGSSRHE
ncbi:cytochrome b/b6 domain protein [mine drainage metagenome]|uniref:Cytochrome b/b6 domain protein n=1 Tax=mine drainage metagenome TaxID=410659 RepID=T0YJE7_9ZZZZ